MGAFDKTHPPVATGGVGLAQHCLDEATKYVMKRKAFGTPIMNHQTMSFMLADMALGIKAARLFYIKAAWQADNKERNTYLASISKYLAGDVANKGIEHLYTVIHDHGCCSNLRRKFNTAMSIPLRSL